MSLIIFLEVTMFSTMGPDFQSALPDPAKKEGAAAPQGPVKNTTKTEKGLFHREGTKERTTKVADNWISSYLTVDEKAKAAGTNSSFSRMSIATAKEVYNEALRTLAGMMPEPFKKELSEIKDLAALEKRLSEIWEGHIKRSQMNKFLLNYDSEDSPLSKQAIELIKFIANHNDAYIVTSNIIKHGEYEDRDDGVKNNFVSMLWTGMVRRLGNALETPYYKKEFISFIDMFIKHMESSHFNHAKKQINLISLSEQLLERVYETNKQFNPKHFDAFVKVLQLLAKAGLPIKNQIDAALKCPLILWGQKPKSLEPKTGSPFGVLNIPPQEKTRIAADFSEKDCASFIDFYTTKGEGFIFNAMKYKGGRELTLPEQNQLTEGLCKYVRLPEIVSLLKGEKYIVNPTDFEKRVKDVEALAATWENTKMKEEVMNIFKAKLNLHGE